ncbi:MAG: response regulator transcription factor [Thermodesulfobacteriota bacterium]
MPRHATAPPATILLVEDDDPTRERLAAALAAHPRLSLLGACGSFAEAEAELARRVPDVLLTDIGLPDGTGIDLIRSARAASPRTQAMVITVFGDEETVVRAIEAGAAGYLLKDQTALSIAESVIELLDGGSPISAPIARLLLRRIAAGAAPAHAAASAGDGAARAGRPLLSEREHEVLNLVAKGFSFPEIARLLGVSPHTVTTHVRHIYEKLEVRSRGEAVFEAVQQGLIRLTE